MQVYRNKCFFRIDFNSFYRCLWRCHVQSHQVSLGRDANLRHWRHHRQLWCPYLTPGAPTMSSMNIVHIYDWMTEIFLATFVCFFNFVDLWNAGSFLCDLASLVSGRLRTLCAWSVFALLYQLHLIHATRYVRIWYNFCQWLYAIIISTNYGHPMKV